MPNSKPDTTSLLGGQPGLIFRLREALRRIHIDISDPQPGWQTKTLENIEEALKDHVR